MKHHHHWCKTLFFMSPCLYAHRSYVNTGMQLLSKDIDCPAARRCYSIEEATGGAVSQLEMQPVCNDMSSRSDPACPAEGRCSSRTGDTSGVSSQSDVSSQGCPAEGRCSSRTGDTSSQSDVNWMTCPARAMLTGDAAGVQ